MTEAEIASYVTGNIEPLSGDPVRGGLYRVSATLTDGTALPCVIVESKERRVDLVRRRFWETRRYNEREDAGPAREKSMLSWLRRAEEIPPPQQKKGFSYSDVLAAFVAGGNTVNHYDIRSLAASAFVIPPERMEEIQGETLMSWTQFQVVMRDGEAFTFGTTFRTEFFDMPLGYSGTDIARIVPAPRAVGPPKVEGTYREKPFFTCYVSGL